MISNGEPNMIASGISPGISNTTNISIPPMTTFLFIGVPPFCLNLIIFRGWCKVFKRVLCLFAAFTVLFCCSVPAFATGVEPGGSGGGGSGIPVVAEVEVDVVDFMRYLDDAFFGRARGYGNFIWNLVDDDVCSHAPQFGGSHSFVPRRTQVDGQIGTYYVCEYCGRAAGEVLEEAYDEYVADTYGSCTRYDGSGNIPVSLFFNGATGRIYNRTSPYVYSLQLDDVEGSIIVEDKLFCSFVSGEVSFSTLSGDTVHFVPDSSSPLSALLFCSFVAPVSGTLVVPSGCPYSVISLSNESLNHSGTFGQFTSGVSAGDTVRFSFSPGLALFSDWSESCEWSDLRVSYGSFGAYIVPVGALGTMYDADTRVSGGNVSDSGIGSYGYVQDGQLYQSTVGTIYNEITNVYQNPVTGETKDVSNWTYDYSDRSYTLNTEEGGTVTVTYGDTNVTISDGGTTYNVYYLTEHDESVPEHHYTSSVTLAPTCTGIGVRTYTCDECGETYTETIPATGHSYQSAVTMSPSCINTGVRTFTCAACSDVYTVSIPATGHTWQVLQTVPTVYDEDGQLVTEGYTLYQCATCGEQYKITADSGGASLPSPGGGGTSTDTDSYSVELDPHVGRGFLATIAHGLTEDLPEVLKAASLWFTEFPAFYSGFTAFLKDGIAGCLPDIPRKTMGFGLSMVTFIGIVKKIIGR